MAVAAPPVYQAIKAELAQFIRQRCEPGSRLPSIQDLSRQLKTGQRNTYRAVRELADEGFLVCRPGSGTYVTEQFVNGWQGDEGLAGNMDITRQVARPLTGLRVCLLANHRPDPFLRPAVQALTTGLTARGAFVYERLPGSDVDDVDRSPDAVIHVQPEVTPGVTCRPGQVMTVLSTTSTVRISAAGRYDLVSVDDEQGGLLAGQRLRQAGCRRPCFIGSAGGASGTPRTYDAASQRRFAGFEHGFGQTIDPALRFVVPYYNSSLTARLARHVAALPQRPDAVFCASDELAVGFVLGGFAVGYEPAEHYAIVGFDGQQSGRTLAEGPLTTVDLPIVEMGMKAVELLTSRLLDPDQAPRRLLLGCSLFEGQTVQAERIHLKSRDLLRQLVENSPVATL